MLMSSGIYRPRLIDDGLQMLPKVFLPRGAKELYLRRTATTSSAPAARRIESLPNMQNGSGGAGTPRSVASTSSPFAGSGKQQRLLLRKSTGGRTYHHDNRKQQLLELEQVGSGGGASLPSTGKTRRRYEFVTASSKGGDVASTKVLESPSSSLGSIVAPRQGAGVGGNNDESSVCDLVQAPSSSGRGAATASRGGVFVRRLDALAAVESSTSASLLNISGVRIVIDDVIDEGVDDEDVDDDEDDVLMAATAADSTTSSLQSIISVDETPTTATTTTTAEVLVSCPEVTFTIEPGHELICSECRTERKTPITPNVPGDAVSMETETSTFQCTSVMISMPPDDTADLTENVEEVDGIRAAIDDASAAVATKSGSTAVSTAVDVIARSRSTLSAAAAAKPEVLPFLVDVVIERDVIADGSLVASLPVAASLINLVPCSAISAVSSSSGADVISVFSVSSSADVTSGFVTVSELSVTSGVPATFSVSGTSTLPTTAGVAVMTSNVGVTSSSLVAASSGVNVTSDVAMTSGSRVAVISGIDVTSDVATTSGSRIVVSSGIDVTSDVVVYNVCAAASAASDDISFQSCVSDVPPTSTRGPASNDANRYSLVEVYDGLASRKRDLATTSDRLPDEAMSNNNTVQGEGQGHAQL